MPKAGYQQLSAWWAAQKPARRQAQTAAHHAHWDATHERVRPLPAEATAQAALTVVTMLYGLSQ